MKDTKIDIKTKGILAGCIYNYMCDYEISHRDLYKRKTNPFPVGVGLIREILHQNKRVVKFQASKQIKLLKFFGIEKDFYYDAESKNYLPIEPDKRQDSNKA